MSLWTLIKICAFMLVMAVMAACGLLAWHIAVTPLDGILSEIVPEPRSIVHPDGRRDVSQLLASVETAEIDPGVRTFDKASELLALGNITKAREKLTTIVNLYPASTSAPAARRIIGEMNMDDILGNPAHTACITHRVKRGESILGIVSKHDTSVDMIMHLNSMTELKGLQPGDELLVMTLDFRLLIEPAREALSVWRAGRFIREFPVRHMPAQRIGKGTTTIRAKLATIDGKSYANHLRQYRAAEKIIQLTAPPVTIRSWNDAEAEPPANAIILHKEDMEELALLTKPGNVVEIR